MRSKPSPVGGSVRPVGGSQPVPVSPRDLYDRGGKRPDQSGGKGNIPARTEPIDNRYRPTKSSQPRPTMPADVTGKPGKLTPRPRTDVPASDRYKPSPTASSPRGNPNVSSAPRPAARPLAEAPRLTTPRTRSFASPAPRSTTSSRYYGTSSHYYGYGAGGSCYGPVWDCWWDPCHGGYGYPYWSWYGGCGSFGWGVSLWYPWYWGVSTYWGNCYRDCWWDSWCSPSYASSYWWYPSSTYCPTYLTVPSSSVIVVETPAAEPGTPVGGSVPAAEPAAGVGARDLVPVALAQKYVELGDFYFKAGRFPEAAEAYARARTYAPNDASVHFVLADAAFATGDYHFAAFLIAEALRLDPAMASADTDKRLFYGDPKVFEEQMAALDRYLESKPYDAQAHLVRGYNLCFSGKPALAIVAFRRVLEISPDNSPARTFLSVLAPAPAGEPTGR